MDILRLHLQSNFYHIISISETWLHSHISDQLLQLDNYFIVRNDREGKQGGGVACFIHCSFRARMLAKSPSAYTESPEFLLLELRTPCNELLLFSSIYRPPRAKFFNDFIEAFSQFSHAYKHIIISGDVNCTLHIDNVYSRHFRDIMHSLSLFIIPSAPTFHTATCDSWLDVIVTDTKDKVLVFAKSETPFINGHDLLELTYDLSTETSVQRTILRRNFRDFSSVDFCNTLRVGVFSIEEWLSKSDHNLDTLDDQLLSLSDIYKSSLNVHAPLRSLRVSRPAAPWMTVELRNRMRDRDRLYKRAKRSNNLLGLNIYRDVRNKLTIDLRKARNDYQLNRLNAINNNNMMWKELRNLGLIKPSLPSPLHFFRPEELNEFYASVANKTPQCTLEDFVTATTNIQHEGPLFDFHYITPEEVSKQILRLKSESHSSGADGISAFCLHQSLPVILPVICDIINILIKLSYYPKQWKIAFILALSKIRTPLSPSDTRPISILPEVSKIAERIFHCQIVNFLNEQDILDPRQSGYRSTFNTQTALLRVTHDIKRGIDERYVTILVLFDFSKAFDTISHSLLLTKLKTIGFSDSALLLLFNYLTGRSQTVLDLHGNPTSWQTTNSGVPQGSVLGPLLFSLFINDISRHLRYTQHMVFADDTQIYLRCLPAEINVGIAKITHDVNIIANYAVANYLTLNIKKSNVLIFGSGAYVNQISLETLPPITINNIVLPYVSDSRNLGVIMQNNLSWSKQVSLISNKVYGILHKLKYHKHVLSTDVRIKLVSTLIQPHFDYCCLVYHGLTEELNCKLQRLMNSCIRFIYDLRRDVHITPFRHNLKWLSVASRRLFFLGVITFKILYLDSPVYLRDILQRTPEGLRRSERTMGAARTFLTPIHRTALYHSSFHLAAIEFWHNLPASITEAPSISIFKSRLFDHLLNIELIDATTNH